MPPGMCLCGAVRREGGQSRFCGDRRAETGVAPRFERVKTTCRSCNGKQGVPTGEQCPPNCPGNEKTDHSKFVEQSPTVPLGAVTISVLRFDVDTSSGQRIPTAASLVPLAARPIYITLCTLVI